MVDDLEEPEYAISDVEMPEYQEITDEIPSGAEYDYPLEEPVLEEEPILGEEPALYDSEEPVYDPELEEPLYDDLERPPLTEQDYESALAAAELMNEKIAEEDAMAEGGEEVQTVMFSIKLH